MTEDREGKGENKKKVVIAPERTLVLITMKESVSPILGVLQYDDEEFIQLRYACMLTQVTPSRYGLTPISMPLDLVAPTFGAEARVTIPMHNVFFFTEVPLIEKSEHKFVTQFVEYWGTDVLTG